MRPSSREYRVIPSLGINVTGTYGQNFSNTELPVQSERATKSTT